MMRVDRNDIWWNYKQIEGEAASVLPVSCTIQSKLVASPSCLLYTSLRVRYISMSFFNVRSYTQLGKISLASIN